MGGAIMDNGKLVSSSHRTSATIQKPATKSDKKKTYAAIYPMMPRGYTAIQRAQLRKFERDLYAGKIVRVE